MNHLIAIAFIDDNDILHINVPRVLIALGIEVTPNNRERYCEIARKHIAMLLRKTNAVTTVDE